jgi:hypothetical protein
MMPHVTLARRASFAARTMTGDLHTALLEAYWIIDVVPGQTTAVECLKESITDAILGGNLARMEQVLDEAEIAIGSELSSGFVY